MTTTEVDPRVVAPVPQGRGRWRLVAYKRQFDSTLPTAIVQLDQARGRRLSKKWNQSAELTFTLDAHSPSAKLLTELATDVVAFRWHEPTGSDVAMFRGLIDHSEDQISESSATVTFVAHDYFGILSRRMLLQTTLAYTQMDQDTVVGNLLYFGTSGCNPAGQNLAPGNWIPLVQSEHNPDGTYRSLSGQLRDRTYVPGTVIGTEIDNLAHVANGFDYDVRPNGPSNAADNLRIFYPQQGVARTDVALAYGANVSTVTRTVASSDYANYVRVIGNKGSADPNAPQFFSERWNTDANNVTVNPVGLFGMVENASDVSVQATLDDKATGDLGYYGALTPSYTLGLRPNAYYMGLVNMGDAVPLYINEGRLNVSTSVRVVGIDYSIGEDGNEDVVLTVGRPPVTLAKLLTASDRDIDALARR